MDRQSKYLPKELTEKIYRPLLEDIRNDNRLTLDVPEEMDEDYARILKEAVAILRAPKDDHNEAIELWKEELRNFYADLIEIDEYISRFEKLKQSTRDWFQTYQRSKTISERHLFDLLKFEPKWLLESDFLNHILSRRRERIGGFFVQLGNSFSNVNKKVFYARRSDDCQQKIFTEIHKLARHDFDGCFIGYFFEGRPIASPRDMLKTLEKVGGVPKDTYTSFTLNNLLRRHRIYLGRRKDSRSPHGYYLTRLINLKKNHAKLARQVRILFR